ncbi:MAG: hypothetical protein CMB53_00210 [Euryarchaeota archaeon]|nr:hypothetical protein [Euryarchaeota archaeon]|tara:strand:+ start:2482 stop:3159 length:678 start_codon:yes stop_codon:yes gene_type:complete
MAKKIHIAGETDLFHNAISDRLTRAGAVLTSEEESELVVSLDEQIRGDIAVLPAHADGRDANLVIRIHDLLIPDEANGWGPSDIHELASLIRNGEDVSNLSDFVPRHWLHVRDATDALSLLIMAYPGGLSGGVFDMTGRRAWRPEEILNELSILWDRFTNAVNYTHTTDSLSSIPSPVPESTGMAVSRPDLDPLHSALRELGSDGWHPLVPMRVALMEVLAHAEI